MQLLVVCGPTASGKTALSVEIARQRNGEIICADSMQIYKYMDIGTAKPDDEEQKGVPHHLFGIIHPSVRFSLAEYVDLARRTISEIQARGNLPILVGGTGLYINTVINGIELSDAGIDEELRARLELEGNETLYEKLMAVDPESAVRIGAGDKRRMIRALEVYHTTGESMTQQNERSRSGGTGYDSRVIYLDIDRDKLKRRINARVDAMIERGLVEEVERLREIGLGETARQAIGYKEILRHLDGAITLDDAIEEIKINTRRYAKRQRTWFRKAIGNIT